MIIRLTERLGKKIGILPTESLPMADNPFLDWSAHLFTAGRIQYIILTNTPSLYSIMMYGRGVKSGPTLLQIVKREMPEYMRLDEHEFTYKLFIDPEVSDINWSKALNRSLTGSMNDFVQSAKILLVEEKLPLSEVSVLLNDTPMSYLKYDCPSNVFRGLRRPGKA